MLWNYPHNWDTPVIERLEWRTDILLAYDGSEQRIALRQTPRRWFEFTFLVDGQKQRSLFEQKLYLNGANEWSLPIWVDATPSNAAITHGDTVLSVDTVGKDFHASGMAVIIDTNGDGELLTIDYKTDNSISVSAVNGDYPTGSVIVPVRMAQLEQQQALSRFTSQSAYSVARFMLTDKSDYALATEVMYRNYPVLNIASNWINDPQTTYERKLKDIDFGSSIYRDDESRLPVIIQSHHWTLDSRYKISNFREFLYSRRGRLTVFWLPTFLDDMELADTIISFDLTINIFDIGYSNYEQALHRRDIRIELKNGTVFYRRITASEPIGANKEQLTLNNYMSINILPNDIARISFMMLARLDTDAAEIAWYASDYAECKLNLRSMTNDV